MTPHDGLPPRNFWKTGAARARPGAIRDLYTAGFAIGTEDRIATAGGSFAVEMTRRLRDRGFAVMEMEPAPPWLPEEVTRAHGYGVFPARHGEIETVQHLLQLAREAFGTFVPAEPVWERRGRFHDAQRPAVDPRGLDTAEEVAALRREHLAQVRRMLSTMDVFVFVPGQTEACLNAAGDTLYPSPPGVVAGSWRDGEHAFRTFTYPEVRAGLEAFIELVSAHNPGFRLILAVSPEPAAATGTDRHVLAATTYGKSVLRAVAGDLADGSDRIDYFPVYEMIASHAARGELYEADLRTVSAGGIDAAMRSFFGQHPDPGTNRGPAAEPVQRDSGDIEAQDGERLREALAE